MVAADALPRRGSRDAAPASVGACLTCRGTGYARTIGAHHCTPAAGQPVGGCNPRIMAPSHDEKLLKGEGGIVWVLRRGLRTHAAEASQGGLSPASDVQDACRLRANSITFDQLPFWGECLLMVQQALLLGQGGHIETPFQALPGKQSQSLAPVGWLTEWCVKMSCVCLRRPVSERPPGTNHPVCCHPGCRTPLEAKMLLRVQSVPCPPLQCDCRLDRRGDGRTCRADAQRSSHASLEGLLRFKLSSGEDVLPEAPHACGVLTWCCPSQHWKALWQEGPCTPLQHLREHKPERWLSSLCSEAAGVALSSKSLDISSSALYERPCIAAVLFLQGVK